MSLQTVFERDVFEVNKMKVTDISTDIINDISGSGAVIENITHQDGKAFTLSTDPPTIDTELTNKKYVDDQTSAISFWSRDIPSATIHPKTPGDKLAGGIAASGSLTIESTINATKGPITLDGTVVSITGNLDLPINTASEGIITLVGFPYIHSFGTSNFFGGGNSGNLTLTGSENTGIGILSLLALSSGNQCTAMGSTAMQLNTTGSFNSAFGRGALQVNSVGDNNSGVGHQCLIRNVDGDENTAIGSSALAFNSSGGGNTACGTSSMNSNVTGSNNTCIGGGADVGFDNLTNATALGFSAVVNASNKVRLGNSSVTVVEGQVAYTFPSDFNLKENFLAVNEEEVLQKISQFKLESWNYKGHDPKLFRHYGPMAQDFYAAFGKDDLGIIGSETTLNCGDEAGILMIAVKALEKRTRDQKKIIDDLKERIIKLE